MATNGNHARMRGMTDKTTKGVLLGAVAMAMAIGSLVVRADQQASATSVLPKWSKGDRIALVQEFRRTQRR